MLASLAVASGLGADQGRTVKEPLDRATIYQDSISKSQPVRVQKFSAENADLGTGAKKNKPKYRKIAESMKEEAPELLLEGILDELKAQGFADVAEFNADEEVGDDCLIVKGEFTKLNPGSKYKSNMVGFGAGKNKTCTTGLVVTPAGEVLARSLSKSGDGHVRRRFRDSDDEGQHENRQPHWRVHGPIGRGRLLPPGCSADVDLCLAVFRRELALLPCHGQRLWGLRPGRKVAGG